MATKNLVPRADNEGNIGLPTKKWAGAHFVSGSFDELKINYAKSSTGTDLIAPEAGGSITVTKSEDGQYVIGGGGGSGSGEQIIKDNTSVSIIDDTSNPGKIEFRVDSNLKWTLDENAFIPESGLDIGTEAKRLDKLYIDNAGLLSIGTSQLKITSNKLQLSNDNGDSFYDLATTNDLSGFSTSEADTLDSVIERNGSTNRSATIGGVGIGQISGQVTLQAIKQQTNDVDIILESETKGLNITYGDKTDSTSLKRGKISIKSDSVNESYIDLYNTTNTFYSRLKGATSTDNRIHTLPNSSGVLALKSEVDAMASGIKVQKTVKAATTDSFTMADTASNSTLVLADGEGGFNAGANTYTVDGVSLVENNRVLIKDGVNSNGTGVSNKWNGIYTVGALTGTTLTLTRADDFNSGDSVSGFFMFVEQGTSNGDQGFVCTNDSDPSANPRPDDPNGTTLIEFSQFTAAGQITGGNGLTKVGDSLNVNADQSSTITAVGTLTGLSVSGPSTFSDNIILQNEKTLTFKESGSINGISIKSPTGITNDYTLTLPTTAGTDGYVLKTNGSGVLSWTAQTGGLAEIVQDDTPQLGGDLDINSKKITGDLIPSVVNKDLGSSTNKWRSLYSTGDIFYGNDIKKSNTSDGLLLSKTTDNSSDKLRLRIETPTSSTNFPELSLMHKNSTSVNGRVIGKFSMKKASDSNEVASIELKSSTNASGFKLNFKSRGADGFFDRITIDTTSNNDKKIQHWLPTEIRAQYPIRFYESSANGSNYAAIRGPKNAKNNYTITLPESKPASQGQILADTDGLGTLEWITNSSFNLKDVSAQLPTGAVDNQNPTVSKIQGTDRLLVMDDSDNDKNTYVEFRDLLFNIYGSNPSTNQHGPAFSQSSQVLFDYTPHNNFLTTTIKENSLTKANLEKIGTTKILGNISKLTDDSVADTANVTEIEVSKVIPTTTSDGTPDHTVLVTQKAVADYVNTIAAVSLVSNTTVTSYTIPDNTMNVVLGDDVWSTDNIVTLNITTNANNLSPTIFLPVGTNAVRLGQSFDIVIDYSQLTTNQLNSFDRNIYISTNRSDPRVYVDDKNYGMFQSTTPGRYQLFNFSSANEPIFVNCKLRTMNTIASKGRPFQIGGTQGQQLLQNGGFLPNDLTNVTADAQFFNPQYSKQIYEYIISQTSISSYNKISNLIGTNHFVLDTDRTSLKIKCQLKSVPTSFSLYPMNLVNTGNNSNFQTHILNPAYGVMPERNRTVHYWEITELD